MNAGAASTSEGLGSFDEYPLAHEVTEEFWTDGAPIGEVIPEQLNSVIHKAIERVGLDVWRDRDAVVQAAKDWRKVEMHYELGSTEWQIATERLRDAIDRLPIVFDIPGVLLENRRAEVQRLSQRLVSEHDETLTNLAGGAS
jgi:hypothetical protein